MDQTERTTFLTQGAVAAQHPVLERVGVFGSYGRGEAGVGSDLDLLLIDRQLSGPQQLRLLDWPLEDLPLSCDALMLTPQEHHALIWGIRPWLTPC